MLSNIDINIFLKEYLLNILRVFIIPLVMIYITMFFGKYSMMYKKVRDGNSTIYSGSNLNAPSVMLHEFAHYIVFKLFGVPIEKVKLYDFNSSSREESGASGYVLSRLNLRKARHRLGAYFSSVAPVYFSGGLIITVYFVLFKGQFVKFINVIKTNNDFFNILKGILLIIKDYNYSFLSLLLLFILCLLFMNASELSKEDMNVAKYGYIDLVIIIGLATFINNLGVLHGGIQTFINIYFYLTLLYFPILWVFMFLNYIVFKVLGVSRP